MRSEIAELETEIQLKIDEAEDERTREVMSLYYVLGMSDEDIAEDLLISSRTVRRILHKGIAELSKG